MTIIYALCEPGTRTVRYLGKTVNLEARFGAHLKTSVKQKNHLGNWLRSLGGGVPNLIKLCEVPDEEGSTEEIRYIKNARMLGFRLVNATDGGEGMPNPSPETRAKLSAARRGLVRSPETCAKLSAAHKGKAKSEEHRLKLSKANLGKSLSLEHRKKISQALLGSNNPNFGKPMSEERKQKLRVSMTPERRVLNLKNRAKEGNVDSQETRDRKSAARLRYLEKEKQNV